MLEERTVKGLSRSLKRIFTTPVTRSTFRELQNAVVTLVEGDREEANGIIESLLRGQIKPGLIHDKGVESEMEKVIEEYSVPIWVAKDVHDKEKFIHLLTTDIVTQADQLLFAHRFLTVAKQEFECFTDVESTIQMIQHLLNRLQDVSKNERFRPYMSRHRNKIEALKSSIEATTNALGPVEAGAR